VGSVTNLAYAFFQATAFDQDISSVCGMHQGPCWFCICAAAVRFPWKYLCEWQHMGWLRGEVGNHAAAVARPLGCVACITVACVPRRGVQCTPPRSRASVRALPCTKEGARGRHRRATATLSPPPCCAVPAGTQWDVGSATESRACADLGAPTQCSPMEATFTGTTALNACNKVGPGVEPQPACLSDCHHRRATTDGAVGTRMLALVRTTTRPPGGGGGGGPYTCCRQPDPAGPLTSRAGSALVGHTMRAHSLATSLPRG